MTAAGSYPPNRTNPRPSVPLSEDDTVRRPSIRSEQAMTRSHKALIVIVVATLGLWGCAQGKSKPTANSDERIKSLEARCAHLESENHTLATARDKAQKLFVEADRARLRLLQEVETL